MTSAENLSLYGEDSSSHYTVRLESFEGPLDLLLHLIKKNELDIYDIPISIIARQYLEYIKMLKVLNLEVAGEFLVMASTLIQIKSKMLLPVPVDEASAEDEEEDPRAELVRRLLEYQKYKEASHSLEEREMLGRDVFARPAGIGEIEPSASEEGQVEVELFELIEAFQKVLARIPEAVFHEVGADSISIAERINDILTILQDKESISFDDLFPESFSRDYVISTFLAVLELCKLKLIKVVQASRCGTILIAPAVTPGEFSEPEEL